MEIGVRRSRGIEKGYSRKTIGRGMLIQINILI
jgi:hypothetical protein